MNPIVEAAWIAGGVGLIGLGGTVAVAIAGFRNTRTSTEQTIEAGTANTKRALDAAREERFWEKQAAAYEASLAAVRYRAATRADQLRMFRMDEHTEKKALESLEAHEPPGWFEIIGRLLAYASDDVLTAYQAAEDADREVINRYLTWRALGEQGEAIHEALKAAQEADEVLTKLIRSELRNRVDRDREAT
jgi:hypothetical protein